MRVVGEIPHPELKITLFHWNNRYLVKLEAGLFEQTFKVNESDVISDEELKKTIDAEFLEQALLTFNQMAASFYAALDRNQ